jgi:hypothetical protein
MQEQKNTIISKETLIPISLIVVVVGIVWSMAISFSKIEMLEQRNSPTRDEFTTLQSDIKEIKGDIKTLLISNKEYEKR